MLELRSIDAGYGSFQALFGINLDVKAGEAVGVPLNSPVCAFTTTPGGNPPGLALGRTPSRKLDTASPACRPAICGAFGAMAELTV